MVPLHPVSQIVKTVVLIGAVTVAVAFHIELEFSAIMNVPLIVLMVVKRNVTGALVVAHTNAMIALDHVYQTVLVPPTQE